MNADRGRALVEATEVGSAWLVPEIRLRLLPTASSFDSFRATHEGWLGASPPYWALAWPGGQALARYILDGGRRFAGVSVLDVGCGCGLAAIASARAGAVTVRGMDRDPLAIEAAALNACLNDVSVDWLTADLGSGSRIDADVVLAGDLWYEAFDARMATRTLREMARRGSRVLCGDVGRAHLPRNGMEHLATYDIRMTLGFERERDVKGHVWELHA